MKLLILPIQCSLTTRLAIYHIILMTTDHNYDLVQTRDGTFTLYSREYGEHMHSLSGAYEEALLKHVYPSGLFKRKAKSIYVLDVGFGLGYNILALFAECAKKNYSGSLSVISLEKEKFFLSTMDRISFNDERDGMYSLIKKAYMHGSVRNDGVYIKIEFGDARDSVKKLTGISFDAVFFDPFSPSKNPELWSVEFFQEIYRLISDTGILTTYSSAFQIRMALIEAGFIIGRGPAVGGKREGTLAAKSMIIDPLGDDEVLEMRRNRRAVPYRDADLSDYPPTIRTRRNEEIKK